ncbi:MAG: sulfotransferase [Chitinophagales bacterium]|nr:sulfotransferase [Chitinophagales bacterium]
MRTPPKFFIAGCGRSGTSLLRTMLNHHPDFFIPPECGFITDYMLFGAKLPASILCNLVLNEPELTLWFKNKDLLQFDENENIFTLIEKIHAATLEKNGKKFWGQKTPRFIRYFKEFKKEYPELKLLFVVRDPRAVVHSFRSSPGFVSYIPEIVNRWIFDNKAGIAAINEFGADVMLIKYEDLISDTESTLKKASEFLHVPYSPQMLEYNKTGNKDYLAFNKKQLQKLAEKPDKTRIASWKNVLRNDEVRYIENRAAVLMDQFGYDRLTVDVHPASKSIHSFLDKNIDRFKKLFTFLTNRPGFLFYIAYRKLVLTVFNFSPAPFFKI